LRAHATDELRLRDWIRREHSGVRAMYQLEVRNVLTPDLMRQRPGDTGNSIVWIAWHLARYEDVLVNLVARGREQVVADGWCERLHPFDAGTGIGATEDEVELLSRSIDLDGVEEYWSAVHDATAEWLAGLSSDELDIVPDIDRRLTAAPDVIIGDAVWVRDLWRGNSVGALLHSYVILHGYRHIGEMQSICGRMGIRGL
jgi:hypothetical protein